MDNLTNVEWLLAAWQIQVAVGSGYTAYMIAYTGIRQHHQPIDITFRTIAFSMVATAVMLSSPADGNFYFIALAFFATIIFGILWRRYGMLIWEKTLRAIDLSWADDTPSAWAKMSGDQSHHITQISVLKADGTRLRCNDASACNSLPMGPCILGTNGDVLMYVTHIKKTGEDEKESTSMQDSFYGAKMTYLPAASIVQLDIRRKPIERNSLINRIRSKLNRHRPVE